MSYPSYPIQGQGQYHPGVGAAGYPSHIQQQQISQQQHQHQHQHPQYTAHNTLVTPPNLSQIAQQGYAQQQQHLAAMQAAQAQAHAAAMMRNPGAGGQGGGGGGVTAGQLQQAQAQAQMQMQMQAQMQMGYGGYPQGAGAGPSGTGAPSHKKKRGPRPTPTQQMIPPQTRAIPTEHYLKQALAPPAPAHLTTEVEPWADPLDEIDPRELAMGRFKVRQEVLTEIFSPDPIKNIPLSTGDAWEGLGMDGETLEAKVAALEKENDELQSTIEGKLETWRKRLQDIEATGEVAVS